MRDLTAILMGDPAATYRRPPTPEERAKANMMPQAGDSYTKRYSKDYEWPVGHARVFADKRSARLAQQRLYQKGMAASFTSLPDGTFKIIRVH